MERGKVHERGIFISSLEVGSSLAAASLYSSPPVPKASLLAPSSPSSGAGSGVALEGREACFVVQGPQRTAVALPALPRFAVGLPGPWLLGRRSSASRHYRDPSTAAFALAAACRGHPGLMAWKPSVRLPVMQAPSCAPVASGLGAARSWRADRSACGGAIVSMTLPLSASAFSVVGGTNEIC
jgi:hypothetical protein